MMSGTGRQTTRFREDARTIVAESTGADDRDVVIFCGSGATAAINKIIPGFESECSIGIGQPARLVKESGASSAPGGFHWSV